MTGQDLQQMMVCMGAVVMLLLAVGAIGLVIWMNMEKRKLQAGPWQALAAQHGGQFTAGGGMFGGNRIVFQRPIGELVLETKVLSAMDALGSPYRLGRVGAGGAGHTDGGAYTHARLRFAKRNGPEFAGTAVESARHPAFAGIPSAGVLGGSGVFSTPQELIVILHGAIADQAELGAALHFVSSVGERAAAA